MQHHEVPTEVRQFKGLWIPSEILDLDLPVIAKLLWADIHSFTGKDAYFFKSNDRIAEDYQCSVRSISRAMTALKDMGLIEVTTDGRTRKCRSRVDNLSMQGSQIGEADSPNCPHRIQYRKQDRKQGSIARPILEDVQDYFAELQCPTSEAEKFFDYYQANGWKQGRGKTITDWKAAARNWKRNANNFTTQKRGFDASKFSVDGAINFVNNG